MIIDINILLVGITVFSNLFLGALTLLSARRNPLNISFALLILVIDVWIIFNYSSYLYTEPNKVFFLAKFVLFFAILIGYFFYLFIDVLIIGKFKFRFTHIALTIFAIINLYLALNSYFFSSILIVGESFKPVVEPWILFFSIMPVGVILYSVVRLVINTFHSEGIDRKRLLSILIGCGIMFLLIILFDFVLPSFFSNTIFIPLGTFFTVPFTAFTAYAIVKFQLFNVKVIATQLATFSLWIILLIRALTASSVQDQIIDGGLFIVTIVIGILLIRSVMQEVKQREQLEILTEALEEANDKLKDLDKLKTEFLSLASHQLRSPLTAIKGYTSMLLEGSFGEVKDPNQKEAIDRVFQSSNHLAKVVEDLLNVTKIEQGGMKYEMASFDFGKAVSDLAQDLSVTAQKKGLELTYSDDGSKPYTVNGDMEKIRQVILNLIDNSIKYTAKGWIKVEVKRNTSSTVLFSVSDSGMGATPEIIATLFQKFSRGEGGKVNTGGSGLGLYLAKQIVEAHKGRVWVESPGKDKGATFFVELNLA